MATRLVLFPGQSNHRGLDASSPPAELPLATVDYFRHIGNAGIDTHVDTTVTTLRVTPTPNPSMGPEAQAGIDVAAGAWAGDRIVFVKAAFDSAQILFFAPGASQRYFHHLLNGCCAVRHLLVPGFRAYLVLNQGEAERNDAGLAAAWTTNFNVFYNALKTELGVASLPKVIIRLRSGIGTENAVIRTQQEAVADAIINRDDTSHIGDNLHDNCAAQITIGSRVATALVSL